MIVTLIIVIVIALIVAMLLFPVTIYIHSARSEGKMDGVYSISWIIFVYRYVFKDKEKPPKKEVVKKARKIPSLENIFNLIGPLLRLVKELICAVRLKYLDINITFGLNDPAYTGILTGFLHAVRGSLLKGHNIRWTADFSRPVLEWDIKAKAAITPIQILPPMVRFIVSRQVLRSIRGIIRE